MQPDGCVHAAKHLLLLLLLLQPQLPRRHLQPQPHLRPRPIQLQPQPPPRLRPQQQLPLLHPPRRRCLVRILRTFLPGCASKPATMCSSPVSSSKAPPTSAFSSAALALPSLPSESRTPFSIQR